MRSEISHAVRGRLRVRYPAAWFKTRRDTLEARVRAIVGVRGVTSSPVTGSVIIDYDPFRLAESRLVKSLAEIDARLDAGADADQRPAQLPRQRGPLLRVVAASSALVAACLPLPTTVTAGLVLGAGLPVLLRAGQSLAVRRRLNGDVLEAATLVLLTLRGSYAAGALLTWLRAAGEYVVARTVVTMRRSLRGMVTPPGQTVIRLETERRHSVRGDALSVGDVIVVEAGQQLPADGVVVRGEALVNQQTMTGEALPVERREGDSVFAATLVEHGQVEVRVERVGLDTAVGQIVRAIEEAAAEKSDIQEFAERLSDRDVGRTLVLAALGALVSRSINAATAILVADYGTAARVGIPTAIMTSMRRATRQGILIKGPRALENLARVDTVVFDKTGTLTLGSPQVVRVASYDEGIEEADIVSLAAAAERGFRHPIARAINRLALDRRLTIPEPTATALSVGLGVDVRIAGKRVLVGSRRFMASRDIDLTAAATDEADAHGVGGSVTFLAINGRLAGMLVLQDELRPDAREAVRALRARRMRNVIMLSGDHAEPSRVIADSLGLRHHYADLLPKDKATLIRGLRAEGRVVAMVGDGVNDALALEEADVGIAVPGGAQVATEAADVVLLKGGLDRVVRALDLARESIAGIRRTLGIAARANLGVVGLASVGLGRPVPSILLSHGTTVAAAVATAARPEPAGASEPPARP